MTLDELLGELERAGLIAITGLQLPAWLSAKGIDPETPIPVWNDEAQAWEV